MSSSTQPGDHGRIVGGIVLIGLGLFFFATQIFDFGDMMDRLWPFFVIIPGLAFVAGALGSKASAGLMVPGSIVTGTGAILLYQNISGNWESWAYMWTLYPVFLGLAFMFMAARSDNDRIGQRGRGFVAWGLIGLVGLGALFELVIWGDFGSLTNIVLPLLMIGVGVYLLLRRGTLPMLMNDEKPKMSGPSADITPNLKRKIDEALKEEDQTV
ncbi:MAG: hypothetical protein HXY40_09560 [Chloroflexi bacterium]|nr:hypothetical protein [Chloroflexota bacterium]